MNNIRLIIFLSTLFFIQNGYTQVTIGSDEKPVEGALLQLKNTARKINEEANSTKGLGLPRVNLTSIDNLFPMFAKADGTPNEYYNTKALKDKQDELHTGLILYNTNSCLTNYGKEEGIYVWDGIKWNFLFYRKQDINIYKDTRDQILGDQEYPYSNFGEEAGVWMLENIRYIPNDNGISMEEGYGSNNYTDSFYGYPASTTPTIGNPPSTWVESFGMLYTYSAATLREQDTSNKSEGQGEADEMTQPRVQGVCPPGWHIPTDTEWNLLEKELYNNATLYSMYNTNEKNNNTIWEPFAWQADWSFGHGGTVGYGSRGSSGSGGHSYVGLSPCFENKKLGESLPIHKGGLNLLPIGYAGMSNVEGYGIVAPLWCSSADYIHNAWYRNFNTVNPKVDRGGYRRYFMFAVRCKQD